MLLWTFQITLTSIILIFLVHYLINFFKSTLTVPKVKDLVNSPIEKYKNMYNIIDNTTKYVEQPVLKEDNASMKDELKNFLKKQLNTDEVTYFDATPNMNSYLKI